MTTTTTPDVAERFDRISIDLLDPSPLNPRKRFEAARLADLERSIESRREVLVPLLIRDGKKGRFEIIDGERRWRAVTRLSQVTNGDYGMVFRTVPAVIRQLSDAEVLEIQLISAIQRQDLTPLEEAAGYRALIASNPSHYSAAYIGDKIGRSEKYVFDRMKLLNLIPVLKTLLEAERMLVGHAELLAKLKPEDQERALEAPDRFNKGRGLWQDEHDRLRLDEDDDAEPTAKNLFKGLKPVTVNELESWIAHHVRFDVEHMAAAAPLDFGTVKSEVETAKAEPGRGRKVISITNEYRVDDDAKDPTERTYGSQSWQRADGKAGSKTCDHSVLGVFVAGPGYGTTLRVCVNRDKCTVHFGKEIKEREKNQKLRAQGKGGQAAQNEKKSAESQQEKWKREAAERKAREQAWQALWKHVEPEALRQVKAAKGLTPQQVKHLEHTEIAIDHEACKRHGLTWWKAFAAAFLVSEINRGAYCDDFEDFVKEYAKPLGLNLKPLEAIRDTHQAKIAVPAVAPKQTKAKKAKKAKGRK